MTSLDGHETLSNAEFRALIAEAVGELQEKAYGPTIADLAPPKPRPEWSATKSDDVPEGTILEDRQNGYLVVRRGRGGELMKVERYVELYPDMAAAKFGTYEPVTTPDDNP